MGALFLLSFMPNINSFKKVSLFADIQHRDSLGVVFQDDGVMDALNEGGNKCSRTSVDQEKRKDERQRGSS